MKERSDVIILKQMTAANKQPLHGSGKFSFHQNYTTFFFSCQIKTAIKFYKPEKLCGNQCFKYSIRNCIFHFSAEQIYRDRMSCPIST